MGELEGIGEAVTGTMAAAAVEPATGAAARAGDGACLNCGVALAGAYCASCGQKARIHHSLTSFFHDFVQGLLNFEGKIWRTLPMLAWRPGQLTRRYIDGQRASFISPVALYLFSVFLMFAVLNFTGAMSPDFDTALKQERAELQRLEAARRLPAERRADLARIERQIAQTKEDIAGIEQVRRRTVATNIDGQLEVPAWLREPVRRAQANPELAVSRVQDTAAKYSWLLIPLSVPFLWLLFPFSRRFRLYHHTVFVTYSLSFMMMLVVLSGLLVAAGAGGLASFLILLPPLHIYRQLKGAYLLSRWGALWRAVLLVSFAFVAAGLFFVAALAIGIL